MARKPDAVGLAKDGSAVPASAARSRARSTAPGKRAKTPGKQAKAVAAHVADTSDTQRSRELLDFIALVMLAIKEEIEDLRQVQSRSAQMVTQKLIELGGERTGLPGKGSAMAGIISLMQGDDLSNQRQQHVVNALRYVDDLIREHAGRDWEPRLSERAIGWGEGLLAGQTLEQVRAHFHHYLLDRGQSRTSTASAGHKQDEVELF